MRISLILCRLIAIAFTFALGVPTATAQLPSNFFELTKLHDFTNTTGSGMRPYSVPTQVGNQLWFTMQSGGTSGFGAIGRWDLATSTFTTPFAAMDNTNGNTPQGKLEIDGSTAYLTTTRGGTGDRGVLARFDLLNPSTTYSVLWNSPSNSPNTNPNTLVGNPSVVDRGTHKEIYFLTRNGGTDAAHGTVQKYRTDTNTVTLVANLPGLPDGRQPLNGGFSRVGDALYFTTFTGGSTATNPNANNGVGTLMRVDLTNDSVTTLSSMPVASPGTRFPANNPTYDAVTNSLYFTVAGTSTNPGGLMQYDLSTNTLHTLTLLTPAPTTSGPFPDGRFAYSEVVIHEGFAYFATIQGGDFDGGTLNRFNLATNTMSNIWHLGNDTNLSINWGLESRGGPMLGSYNGQDYLFLLTRTGGEFNQGTLLAMAIPEPGSAIALIGGLLLVFLSRKRGYDRLQKKS